MNLRWQSIKGCGDSQALPAMLDGIEGKSQEVIGDGTYDVRSCYEAIHRRGAKPIIPPRKGAQKSGNSAALRARDDAIHRIREQKRGRRRWKREQGYHRRSLVETAMHRLKAVTGPRLKARRRDTQGVETGIKLLVLKEPLINS